jgi:hypothetical protein
MKRALAAVALFLFITGFVFGQQPAFHDQLLDHFQGRWVLQGTIHGQETTHDIANDWVLGHQYLKIHEVSREKNAKGDPAYEATVFVGWDEATSQYVCIWLDTYGGFSKSSVAHAPRSGDEIRFVFNDGKSDFHTTFLYDRKGDSWEWRMDSENGGTLKPFARVKLTKSRPSA